MSQILEVLLHPLCTKNTIRGARYEPGACLLLFPIAFLLHIESSSSTRWRVEARACCMKGWALLISARVELEGTS
jgi:hypothetical protein